MQASIKVLGSSVIIDDQTTGMACAEVQLQRTRHTPYVRCRRNVFIISVDTYSLKNNCLSIKGFNAGVRYLKSGYANATLFGQWRQHDGGVALIVWLISQPINLAFFVVRIHFEEVPFIYT